MSGPAKLPRAQSASGVSFAATDADLPASAAGHPVILVIEDSGSVDTQGNPQATLRYWSGTAWLLIGLAGGGAVASDFIDVAALMSGVQAGDPLVWDASHSRFHPGALVPE